MLLDFYSRTLKKLVDGFLFDETKKEFYEWHVGNGCGYEAEVNLEWMEGAGENPVLRVITAIQLTEKEKQ